MRKACWARWSWISFRLYRGDTHKCWMPHPSRSCKAPWQYVHHALVVSSSRRQQNFSATKVNLSNIEHSRFSTVLKRHFFVWKYSIHVTPWGFTSELGQISSVFFHLLLVADPEYLLRPEDSIFDLDLEHKTSYKKLLNNPLLNCLWDGKQICYIPFDRASHR